MAGTTKRTGNLTEAQVMTALLGAGNNVLVPWGDNQRYDLVMEKAGRLHRVQCKTAYQRFGGSLTFATSSSHNHVNGGKKNYCGEADYFGVYFPKTGRVYLVPVEECGVCYATLRIVEGKARQNRAAKRAEDYEVGPVAL
jgi:hypothetical protein